MNQLGKPNEASKGYAAEVLEVTRAKIPTVDPWKMNGHWALSNEGESYTTGDEQEEPLWVPI